MVTVSRMRTAPSGASASSRPGTRDVDAHRIPEEEKMPRKLITLCGLVALSACSGSAPAAEAAEETPVLDLALRLPVGTASPGL